MTCMTSWSRTKGAPCCRNNDGSCAAAFVAAASAGSIGLTSHSPYDQLLETYANAAPDRARCTGRDGIFVRPVVRVGDERAVGIERVAGQESGGRIALVEEVAEAREELEMLRDVVGALQIDHRIAGNPAAADDIMSSLAVGSAAPDWRCSRCRAGTSRTTRSRCRRCPTGRDRRSRGSAGRCAAE